MFDLFCKQFGRDLVLSKTFLVSVIALRKELDKELRWPEMATFEEMNIADPGSVVRAFLWSFHESKISKEKSQEILKAVVSLGANNAVRQRIVIPMLHAEIRRRERAQGRVEIKHRQKR